MSAQRLEFRGEYAENRKEIHNAVRASVGNRCVRCGHPEGDTQRHEHIDDWAYSGRMECGGPRRFVPVLVACDERCTHARDGKLRILTVHHLDGDKANNRWWNLLPLCQVCHLQIQAKVIPERPWLFDHSPWFVPYVCGFYASYYGGEEITREQADAEPARWLALNPAAGGR